MFKWMCSNIDLDDKPCCSDPHPSDYDNDSKRLIAKSHEIDRQIEEERVAAQKTLKILLLGK